MPFDLHANLAISVVAVAPSPPDSGLTLTVQAGQGVRFPAPPFNVTIWAASSLPTPTTAEVARCTALVGDVLTLIRAAEPPAPARTVLVGDLIAETITAKALQDIESGTNFPLISTPGDITSGGIVTAPIGTFGNLGATPLPLHAPTHAGAGSDPVHLLTLADYPGGTTTFLRADATFAAPASGPPAAHHLTHETGGSDAVVALSAAVLTSGALPFARVPLSAASRLLGRGSAAGAGAMQELTLGTGLALAGTVLNASGGVPAAHHATHETGGSDAVVSLSAAVLTSGTLDDARLSSSVVLEYANNVFTSSPQTFQGSGSTTLVLTEGSQPVDQRRFDLINHSQALEILAVTDGGIVMQTPLSLTRGGHARIGGDTITVARFFERGRSVALGEWIDVPYNAGNFTTDVGTWTVDPGDVLTYAYTLIGKTLILMVRLTTTTIAGSPGQLRIAIPGFTIAKATQTVFNTISTNANLVSANVGNGFVQLFQDQVGNPWPAGNFNANFQIAISIT